MTSNLDCVGLGVKDRGEFGPFLMRLLRSAEAVGTAGGIEVRRWEDPSGARLVFGLDNGQVVDVVPSFAGPVGARLAGIGVLEDDVCEADVVDEDGETVTRLAFDLEERRFLPAEGEPASGPAVVVGLGVEVSGHPDEEAFATDPASLLDPTDAVREPPPDRPDWPSRMAAESFLPIGLFGKPSAYGRLHGTVLRSEERTVAETGQQFVWVVVKTAGFEANVCVPAGALDAPPEPGTLLGGTVYLAGSVPSLLP